MTSELIRATYQGRLARVAGVANDPTTAQAWQACQTIRSQLQAEADSLRQHLDAAGHAVTWQAVAETQRHQILLRVDDADQATQVADTLASHGYERWQPLTGAALRSSLHHGSQLTLAKTDDYTIVVRVRWRSHAPHTTIERVFTPTIADWEFADLPAWAWRGYSVVRPVRLVLERLGARDRTDKQFAPFLATPTSLITPLLKFAQVTEDDVVADIGCGDGRIVIAAAQQLGCQAVGIERSAPLVELARQRTNEAGLSDRVRIEHGSAADADLGDATVVILFLSFDAVAMLLPTLLSTLPRGARIIAHEQSELPTSLTPPPNHSELVIGSNAITVAHRWLAQ